MTTHGTGTTNTWDSSGNEMSSSGSRSEAQLFTIAANPKKVVSVGNAS